MAKLMTAEEAVKAYIKDGMTIATNGFVGAVQPEGMMRAIQKSFLEGGTPRDLTLVHAAGQGGGKDAEGNVIGYHAEITSKNISQTTNTKIIVKVTDKYGYTKTAELPLTITVGK